jgi:hypothetical protein
MTNTQRSNKKAKATKKTPAAAKRSKKADKPKQQPTPIAAAEAIADPARTARLNERAMLVTLSISWWTARKADKKVTNEVAEKYQADATMGSYSKHLVAQDALKAVNSVVTAAYNEHLFLTLPWTDGGARILGSAAYFAYAQKMREHQAKFEAVVRDFVANYEGYVEAAKVRLNGLFDAADYPRPQDISKRFKFVMSVDPVPAAPDFRVDLGESETALVRQQITAHVESKLNDAMKDIWTRLRDVVSKMAERLRAYKVTPDGVTGAFRDSLVANIVELIDVVPALNIANDPTVDEFVAAIRAQLVANPAQVLRDDEKIRTETAAAAEAILAKMEAFIA